MVRIEKFEYRGIRYLLYYPKNYVKGKKFPVVFHLHGAGSRGNNFEEFNGSIILKLLEEENSPLSNAFCVFPQCSEDNWYCVFNLLCKLTKHIYHQSFTDKKRFSISGVSMGGYALYSLIMCMPELFSKALICCGGGMYWNSGRIKKIKFRIFHGEKDVAVYPEEAIRMYNRLKEAEADVFLTLYPDCDHNCWEKTYSNFENLQWLVE